MPGELSITTMCGTMSQDLSPMATMGETVSADRQLGGQSGSLEGLQLKIGPTGGARLGTRGAKPVRIEQDEEWSRMIPFAFFSKTRITTTSASMEGASIPLQSVKTRVRLLNQEGQNYPSPTSCEPQEPPAVETDLKLGK